MRKKPNAEYQKGTIADIFELFGRHFKEDPKYLRAIAAQAFPKLNDPARCANCDANMEIQVFRIDTLKVVLLIEMAKVVRQRLTEGVAFNLSNAVHVPSMTGVSHTVKCQTTMAKELGLIRKMLNADKEHVPGMWAINPRGFQFLAGLPVPAWVKVWRGDIIERTDETITLEEARRVHDDLLRRSTANRKRPVEDYRKVFATHDPVQWAEYAGPYEGTLF